MALTRDDLQAISDLMDVKLQPVNDRFDKMEIRLDKMDSRLDKMEIRLDKIDSRLDKMEIRLDKMEIRLDNTDKRVDSIEIRLERLESDVSGLKAGQLEIRKNLKEIDQKVFETYHLALDAWGRSVENRTWLEKNKLEGIR